MSGVFECPSCGTALRYGATECECGWNIPTRRDATEARKSQKRAPVMNSMSRDELQALESMRCTSYEQQREILAAHRPEIEAVTPHRRWAKKILILHEANCRVAPIALEMAREVMGDARNPA